MDTSLTAGVGGAESRSTAHPVVIALCLSAGPVVALAFTRFAYTLLLPPMRADLGWSFAVSGGITASNAAGYLIGAATTGLVARRFGELRCFVGGMAISAVSLLLTALLSNYLWLNLIRAMGGYATAIVFIVGAALASRVMVSGRGRSSQIVSIYMSGVGVGIVLAGIGVPWSLEHWGERGWREGWLILGIVAAGLVVPALYGARQCVQVAPGRAPLDRTSLRLLPTFLWYVLFGAGYVTYMTFVAALLKQQGSSPGTVAVFFIVLGVACMAGTLFVWGYVLHRLHSRIAPAVVSFVVALGILPVLLIPGIVGAFASAVVFGIGFMAGPAVVTIIVQRTLPQPIWTASIALLTVAFSLGQALGPVLSGIIADGTWGISGGFWLSFALLVVASVMVVLCPHPATER